MLGLATHVASGSVNETYLGGLRLFAVPTPTTAVFATVFFVTTRGIESSEIFSNRTGRLFRLWRRNRSVTGRPLFLIHIRFYQARIDRECFAPEQPSSDAPRYSFKILPAALAVEAAEAAIASCKGQGYNTSVAIVDRAGDLRLLLVGEGASALSRELSRRKAYTSAMRRITTADLAKQVATPGAFNPTVYDTQMVAALGGVPIKVGNETIGAIGVSGAPGGDKDEACANAGLAKIETG
jgi:uncharacterized protein GlcG (DUF336 family)